MSVFSSAFSSTILWLSLSILPGLGLVVLAPPVKSLNEFGHPVISRDRRSTQFLVILSDQYSGRYATASTATLDAVSCHDLQGEPAIGGTQAAVSGLICVCFGMVPQDRRQENKCSHPQRHGLSVCCLDVLQARICIPMGCPFPCAQLYIYIHSPP